MSKTKTKKPLPYSDDRSPPSEREKEEEPENFYDTGGGNKWTTMTRLLPLKRVL